MTAQALPSRSLLTPSIGRRLLCFVYEGVLLFGVLMAAGLVYGVLTRQQNALVGTLGLQAFVFVVLAAYFVYFWTRGGQTLAMQTWNIRVVRRDGRPLSRVRALCRYLLAWLWFLPALGVVALSGLKGGAPAFAILGVGVLTYAALARLHPDRQFWHDAACGTRLAEWRPARRP